MRAVPRTSTGLLALVVAVALAGVCLLLWPATPETEYRPAEATVVQSAECGSDTRSRDVVRIEIDGRPVLAVLDGCGNRQGEVLDVEVAPVEPGATPDVRLAGTGVTAESATRQRMAAVLAAVAGAAGAVLGWRLRSGWPRPARTSRHGRSTPSKG